MSYEKPMIQELGDALDLTQSSAGESMDVCGCPQVKPMIGELPMNPE